MAQDIFAPKSSFNIGYERVVSQPVEDKTGETQAKFQQMANEVQAQQIRAQTAVDNAKMGIVGTLFQGAAGFAGGYAKQEATRIKTEKTNALANEYLDKLKTASTLRDQGEFSKAALMEQTAANIASAGGLDLDKYKTEYEQITGRQAQFIGQTPEQQSLNKAMQSEQFQTAYLAARAKLGPEASEEDVVNTALTSVTLQANAANKIALVKAGTQLEWDQIKGDYETVLKTVQDGTIADFLFRTSNGVAIGYDEYNSALRQVEFLETTLIKPAYVTEEQWSPIKQKLEAQKNLLKNLRDDQTPDNQKTGLISQLLKYTDDPIEQLAIIESTQGLGFVANAGVEVQELLNRVGKSAAVNNEYNNRGRLMSELQLLDVTTPVNANSTFDVDTAPSSVEKYINLPKEELSKNIEAGLDFIRGLKPMEMQNEGNRRQLYNGILSISAGMFSEGDFYTSSKLSQVFNNPNLKASIDMVAAVDREAADEMRILLRSAANFQKTAIEKNVESMESSMRFGGYNTGLTWDDQDKRYYITNEGAIRHGTSLLSKAAINEKGLYIDPNSSMAPTGLKDAYDRRNSLILIDRAMNDLAIEGVEQDITAPTETTAAQLPEGITYDLPEDVQGDTEFLNAVDNTANMLGVTSDQLLAVMDFETIGSFSPSEKSKTSSATGLIQFIESTAGDLGTSTEELAKMTRAEQMVYVDRYLSRFQGRIKNTGDIYMAVHWPRAVGKSDSYVMYSKGSKNYSANQSLDTNNDGTVTRGEALQRLRDVTANKFTDVQRIASAAIEATPSSPRPRLSPSGNVGPRPDDESLASAWDILYSGTHDPETGQLIQGE